MNHIFSRDVSGSERQRQAAHISNLRWCENNQKITLWSWRRQNIFDWFNKIDFHQGCQSHDCLNFERQWAAIPQCDRHSAICWLFSFHLRWFIWTVGRCLSLGFPHTQCYTCIFLISITMLSGSYARGDPQHCANRCEPRGHASFRSMWWGIERPCIVLHNSCVTAR